MVDGTCPLPKKGCKGKVHLGWRFDVVTEVDLSTMEPTTSVHTGVKGMEGDCQDEVEFDVEPVAEKISEILEKAGFLSKMLHWQNKSYKEEEAMIYYRYQNVSVDGTASTVYGSVLGCVKSEANKSFFRPGWQQRGVESQPSQHVQLGEPILPSSSGNGTKLRREWVTNSTSMATTLTFKVAGVGRTQLRLHGKDVASFWEVEFHTTSVGVKRR